MKAKKTAEYVQMPVEVKEMYADAGIVYAKRYFKSFILKKWIWVITQKNKAILFWVNTQENEMKKVYALLTLGERSNKRPLVMSKNPTV